jgi:coniferyl-aldehyde dehydrogenase
MNAPEFSSGLVVPAEFQACFVAQREAFLKTPDPSRADRLADLKARITRRSSR